MNRAYNDNKEYTEVMAGLKFSDEAKARMVQNLLDALAPVLQQGAETTLQATARQAVQQAEQARAERGGAGA